MAVQFDTLGFTEKLISAGMPRDHAIALTRAVAKAFAEARQGLDEGTTATRSDFADLKREFSELSDCPKKFSLESRLESISADLALIKWLAGATLLSFLLQFLLRAITN